MSEPTKANIGASMPPVKDTTTKVMQIDPDDANPAQTAERAHAEGFAVRDTNGEFVDEENFRHLKPNFVPVHIDLIEPKDS
jgi:hypothetical protein